MLTSTSPGSVTINVRIIKLNGNDNHSHSDIMLGGFCFHTAKTSFLLPIAEAKRGLKMLKEEGMKKINFSGGEPFLIQNGTKLAL